MYGTKSTGMVGGYFVWNAARIESEVMAKQVVVPKDKHGIPGSRERGIHYLAATGALTPTLGAARILGPQVRRGEPTTNIVTSSICTWGISIN